MTKTFKLLLQSSWETEERRDILVRHLQGQEGACEQICTCVCLYETHRERGETVMTVLVPFH